MTSLSLSALSIGKTVKMMDADMTEPTSMLMISSSHKSQRVDNGIPRDDADISLFPDHRLSRADATITLIQIAGYREQAKT